MKDKFRISATEQLKPENYPLDMMPWTRLLREISEGKPGDPKLLELLDQLCTDNCSKLLASVLSALEISTYKLMLLGEVSSIESYIDEIFEER